MDEDTGLLRSTVTFPFQGEAPWTRLLFGAGLHFLAGVAVVGAVAAAATALSTVEPALLWLAVGLVAIVAYVPLLGYTATTMRGLLDDDREPPGFGDWGALLRDGRRIAGVTLLYAVPFAALGAGALLVEDGGAALGLGGAAGLAGLGATYVVPAAWVTVINTGELSAAWDHERLLAAVRDDRYLGRWLLAAGLVIGGGALAAALAPFVVGFAVLFLVQVAATYAVTRGVIHALDLSLEDPPPAPASGYVPGWDDGAKRKQLSEGRLGGSLLPTTPGGDDGDGASGGSDTGSTPPTPGSLATTDDGSPSTELDRRDGGPDVSGDGSGGSEAATADAESGDAGSDIERFDEDGEDA